VTVIAHELRGLRPAGGMGTATTFLALGLARLGHAVEILLGKHSLAALDPGWARTYDESGVRIREVPRDDEPVEPWEFANAHSVFRGLVEDPPDVVVAHDFGAPAYVALRAREVGIAFERTLFVLFCHGPRRYVVDLSPSVALGDLRAVLGVSLLEQADAELADVVVSPSNYLLEWMRERGWRMPERKYVIPYFTRSEATGEAVRPLARPERDVLQRFAFFGRVDEKKGVTTFATALNALEPDVLRRIEIEFVGRPTGTWPRERIESLLPALGSVAFETDLDQQAALARLSRPGTLVVMPSLQENSPNTVYECLELGIPFIASSVGGVPELIAPEDRGRVLFEPTAAGLEAALRRVLAAGAVPTSARPAYERGIASERWDEVLSLRPRASAPAERVELDESEWALLLAEGDVADPELVETLMRAQQATQADVVTCGIRIVEGSGTTRLRFFPGDPGGLGALENGYGSVALVRRALLHDSPARWPDAGDLDWSRLARLATSGASIVSVPLPLVERLTSPGSVETDPAAALLAVHALERGLAEPLRGAARLAAGLAASDAEITRRSSRRRRPGSPP
jgi:glycosyltransferase involved in cell wall biosynthesis